MILPCGCSNIWFYSGNWERLVNSISHRNTSGLFLPLDPWWNVWPFETPWDCHNFRTLFWRASFFDIAPMPMSDSHRVWAPAYLCPTLSISFGEFVPQYPPSNYCLLGCIQEKGGSQKWWLVQQSAHEILYYIANIETTRQSCPFPPFPNFTCITLHRQLYLTRYISGQRASLTNTCARGVLQRCINRQAMGTRLHYSAS